jgi:hypothetical protein
MDGDGEGPASAEASAGVCLQRDARGRVAWSDAVGAAIVGRTAAGETLRGICRDPAMPQLRTVVKWLAGRAGFRAAMDEARVAAGGPFRWRRSGYCEETARAIWTRLAGGEPLVRICADPSMPCWSTVHRWMKDRREFGAALREARVWVAERIVDEALELCRSVTPATAQAARTQLAHLRWHAGKMGPKTYGTLKAQEPSGGYAGPQTILHTYIKKYVLPTKEEAARGEGGRWSEEPPEHHDSMVVVRDPTPWAGEKLPPPPVMREPASCQGPNPTRLPTGGAVEAEVETPGEAEDFWATPEWSPGAGDEWT